MRDHITRHAFLATSTRSLGQLKCSRMSTFRQPASFEEDAIEALKHRIMHMKLAESDEFRVMSNGNVARAGHATAMDVRHHANIWAIAHGKMPCKAPLPKALDERIKVWFSSINRNSGQSLTAKDVAKALEMGGITSDKHSVMQLIQSIDLDNSGTIELHEFEVFIREVVARGHFIDESTILLPSGQNILHDMIAGGDRRARWAHDEGDKALAVIESQRNLAHMVTCHQKTLRRRSSILMRPSDIACTLPSGVQATGASARKLAISRQDTFARLAAAEASKLPKATDRYRSRRKHFRKMLQACVRDARPVMETMLQTLCRTRTGLLSLARVEGSAESCSVVQARPGLQNSLLLSLLDVQQQHFPAQHVVERGAATPEMLQDVHLQRLQGLQVAEPESCAQMPSLLLQPPSHAPTSRCMFTKLPQTCSSKVVQKGSQGREKSRLQSLGSDTASYELDGRQNGSLVLAPTDASPRHGNFGPNRTASAVISSLYDRVQKPCGSSKARNLQFQWNRNFVIAQGSNSDSPWHDVTKMTTGVSEQAKARLLRDGGLAATPLLPSMCKQDLDARRRLKPLPEDVAAKRMEYARNRNRGRRPPYVCGGGAD